MSSTVEAISLGYLIFAPLMKTLLPSFSGQHYEKSLSLTALIMIYLILDLSMIRYISVQNSIK